MDAITKDDYTARYVEAATRALPVDQREDYAAELRASIQDQIDGRVEAGEEPSAAERAVLTELGDPEILAAGYSGRQLQLIGPRYYSDWKRLLVLLLWIVVPVATLGGTIGPLVRGEDVGDMIAGAIVVGITGGLHVCFWVTLAFALVERFGAPTARGMGEWKLDMLPLTAVRRTQFSEVVLAFVAPVIFAAAVAWDQLIGFIPWEVTGGEALPLLSPGLWPWGFVVALAAMLVTALLTLVAYLHGRWATWMGVANAVVALGITAAAVVLAATGRLLNPDWEQFAFGASAAGTIGVIRLAFAAGIALLGLCAAWDAFRRTRSVR